MRTWPRWIGALTAGFVAAVSIAGTAAAHIHVDVDGEAVAGQRAQLRFVVPNERTDTATVAIEVQMPREADVVDVVPTEVEGWTITVTLRSGTVRSGTVLDGDLVDTIRWEATGPGLTGEQSVSLPVAVGPLPAVEVLTFPTLQRYDDGEIVRWIEPAPAGGAEPALPLPALAVSPAAPGDTTPTEPPVTPSAAPPEPTEATAATVPTVPTVPTEPTAAPATEPTTPDESLVIAPAPSATDDVSATSIADDDDADDDADEDGDDDTIWPWVVGGIVIVIVGGGIAAAVARRRTSP